MIDNIVKINQQLIDIYYNKTQGLDQYLLNITNFTTLLKRIQ